MTKGPFSSFGSFAAINAGGTVAFRASLDVGGSGIFAGSGGPITTIADTSGPFRPGTVVGGFPECDSGVHPIVPGAN